MHDMGMSREAKWTVGSSVATLVVYAASLASSAAPDWVGVALAAVVTAAAIAAFAKRFEYGMAVVVAELAGGSLGLLASFGHGLSLRMALFLVAFAASAMTMWRDVEARRWVMNRGFVAVYASVALAVTIGMANGIARNGFASAFSDFNAYLYFLLLPAFMIAFRDRSKWTGPFCAIVGAVLASAALTLVTFVMFTHSTPEPVLRFMYKWVRDYGLGEITRAPGGFYRVFFQAHLYELIALPWLVVGATIARTDRVMAKWAIGASLVGAVVFVSFSRTFWLSGAIAMASALVAVMALPAFRGGRMRFAVVLVSVAIASLAVPFLLSRSVGGAAIGRATSFAGEAAASSRMNLLGVMWPAVMEHPWIGSGFGKRLTYETKDPRLLAYFPDGRYTTSAFEWGWLDFWLKMGILGPLSFLLLVATIVRLAWSVIRADRASSWTALWIGVSTVAVAAAHVLSPWLNHPLGIGFLLLAYATLVVLEEESRVKA